MSFKRHLPNVLTVIRLGLAFAFPALPHSWRLAALGVAAATEYLDGALSRWWNVESQFGRMLDPVVALVALRDITVAGGCIGVLLFSDRDELTRMRPRLLGKVTTAFQFGFLLTLVIWQSVPTWLTAVTAVFSGLAAIDYVRHYFQDVRHSPPEASGGAAG